MGSEANRRRWQLSIAAGLVALVVVLLGGYRGKWSWTGFADNDTLWDWLKLLMLPLVLATTPIWIRHGGRVHKTRRRALLGVALAFVVLVIVGYAANLKWTGFPDNKLWDWFTLLMLPLAIGLFRVWRELEHHRNPRKMAWLGLAVAGFGLLVGLGYALDWAWTGFPGNTLWDWINLLLAPILFALIVVPATISWMSAEIAEEAEEIADERAAAAVAATPPGPVRQTPTH